MQHWFFVWTVSDIIGATFWGLVILFFAGCFAIIGVERLWHKVRRLFTSKQGKSNG